MQVKIEYVLSMYFVKNLNTAMMMIYVKTCVFERYKTKTFILRNIFLVQNKIESSKPKETVLELT
jgi:hypothetical protein